MLLRLLTLPSTTSLALPGVATFIPLFVCGCATAPSTPFGSGTFTKPPVVHRTGSGYQLHVFENESEPSTVGAVAVAASGGDLHVSPGVRISMNGSVRRPRVFPLRVPSPPGPGGRGQRFYWRDPDGSLHPIEVRAAGTAGDFVKVPG